MQLKHPDELSRRITEVEQTLRVLDGAIAEELKRPFFSRRRAVLQFIDTEKKIHQAILSELKWVLNE